ncbi:MAG: hypothetical protein RLZZ383_920 [Pseudomonadota bacterium]|jgi:hypothetical protein
MWAMWLWVGCAGLTGLEGDKAPVTADTGDAANDTPDTPTADTAVPGGLDTASDTPSADTAQVPPVDTAPPPPPPPPPSAIPSALEGLNLLVNPGNETGDLTGWTVLTTGGDGLAALASGPHTGTFAAGTSYGFSDRGQLIDLLAAGFSADMLDAVPRVHVETWVREMCTTGDSYELEITLLDAAGAVLATRALSGTLNNGVLGCDYADDTWQLFAFDLVGYPAGVRTISYREGGDDAEFWAGHYGVFFDDAVVALYNP